MKGSGKYEQTREETRRKLRQSNARAIEDADPELPNYARVDDLCDVIEFVAALLLTARALNRSYIVKLHVAKSRVAVGDVRPETIPENLDRQYENEQQEEAEHPCLTATAALILILTLLRQPPSCLLLACDF